MRDHQDHRPAAAKCRQEITHRGFGVDVQRARGLVEHQDAGPARKGPGDGHPLALTTRQRRPVEPDSVIKPIGPLLELRPKPGIESCLQQHIVVELVTEKPDVVGQGAAEQLGSCPTQAVPRCQVSGSISRKSTPLIRT